jgi:hypothetical protein
MKAVAGGASFEGITRKENSHEIRWNRRSQTLLCLCYPRRTGPALQMIDQRIEALVLGNDVEVGRGIDQNGAAQVIGEGQVQCILPIGS